MTYTGSLLKEDFGYILLEDGSTLDLQKQLFVVDVIPLIVDINTSAVLETEVSSLVSASVDLDTDIAFEVDLDTYQYFETTLVNK